MKRLSLVVFLAVLLTGVAHAQPVAEVLEKEAKFTLISPSEARYEVHQRVRVNKQGGAEAGTFLVYTDEFRSLSSFSGRISPPEHSSAQEMECKVLELTYENLEPYVDDIVLYLPIEPYGIAQGDTLSFFMPGAYIDALPEELVDWLRMKLAVTDQETLPFMALYNRTAGAGFSGEIRAEQQEAKGIPAEHMPPGCIWTFQAHVYGLGFQFLRDAGHPDERVDEGRRDAQEVGDPIALRTAAQDEVQFILQAAERHIQQEKQARRAEIDEAEQEAGAVGMGEWPVGLLFRIHAHS